MDIFFPVLPNDSSCANLARAHHNASTMWMMVASIAYQADRPDLFRTALVQMQMHLTARDIHLKIATLNDPRPPQVLIILL